MMIMDHQSSCSLTCPTQRLSKLAALWMMTRSEMFWAVPVAPGKSPQSRWRWFSSSGSLILSCHRPERNQLVSPQHIVDDIFLCQIVHSLNPIRLAPTIDFDLLIVVR